MVDTAARYQAHPAPGSVAELESLYSWLEAQRSDWLEHPDAVAAWHRIHLDAALRLVYREIVHRTPSEIDRRLATYVGRAEEAPPYGPCESPICGLYHDRQRRHLNATPQSRTTTGPSSSLEVSER